MTEMNQQVIELIKEKKTIREVSEILNISEKQLYMRIRQLIRYGYVLEPIYQYNSDIKYKVHHELVKKIDNQVSIKVPSSINEIRVIVISDIHVGNVDADITLLNRVYEYAKENGINIIFNCGDLIEGVHSSDKKDINDIYTQVDTLIKKYPYDKDIKNFTIFENHDCHSLHYDGLDISSILMNTRYDIIPIGYGKGVVNLKEDKLLLSHELSVMENPNIGDDCNVALIGHGHMMKFKIYDRFNISVPSLSYVSPDKTKEVVPGFVDMTIHFEKNKFEFIEAKHLIVAPKVLEVSQGRVRMKTLFKNNNFNKFRK